MKTFRRFVLVSAYLVIGLVHGYEAYFGGHEQVCLGAAATLYIIVAACHVERRLRQMEKGVA